MRYYVLDPSGQRYGPADIRTLNEWAIQGRLTPQTLVEDSSSGMRMAAAAVPGMMFPQVASPGPQFTAYPRSGVFMGGGEKEIKEAWICGWIGLCCCGPLAIFGLTQALKAKNMGNPNAIGPIVLNGIAVAFWILGFAARMARML